MKKFLCILMLLLMVTMITVPAFAVDDPVDVSASIDGVETTATVVTETVGAGTIALVSVLSIAGFALLVGLFVILGLKGKLTAAGMNVVASITGSIASISQQLAAATENKAIDAWAQATTLINIAVAAAQNAFYQKNITKEERHDLCMKYFKQMLKANGVTLTTSQMNSVDILISAACENLGHTVIAEATELIMVEETVEVETPASETGGGDGTQDGGTDGATEGGTGDVFAGTDTPVDIE